MRFSTKCTNISIAINLAISHIFLVKILPESGIEIVFFEKNESKPIQTGYLEVNFTHITNQ
jgi:hypothetical protein